MMFEDEVHSGIVILNGTRMMDKPQHELSGILHQVCSLTEASEILHLSPSWAIEFIRQHDVYHERRPKHYIISVHSLLRAIFNYHGENTYRLARKAWYDRFKSSE